MVEGKSRKEAEEEVLRLLISGPKKTKEQYKNLGVITIILEGILDHQTFTKIKKKGLKVLNIQSIHGLFKIHNIDNETQRLVNNRSLVRKFTKEMNKEGLPTIGILDMDYDGIGKLLGRKVKLDKNILTTSESTDIETLLISLIYQRKKEETFFENIDDSIHLCRNLGLVRCAIERMKKNGNGKFKQSQIKELFPKFHDYKNGKIKNENFLDAKKRHYESSSSVEKIIQTLVERDDLSIETKREITESASYVKNLIEDRLNDVESQWSFYIRGHDLEWFICDKNKFNGSKFRDSLTKFVKYDDIKIHSMFQSLDKWRIENNVPELFA